MEAGITVVGIDPVTLRRDPAILRTVARERDARLGVYGMRQFRAARAAGPPQLVLGFGQVAERAIEPGIAAVAGLLS